MDLMLTEKQLYVSPKLSSHHLFLAVYFKHHQFSNLYFPLSVLGRSTVMSNMSYPERSGLLVV